MSERRAGALGGADNQVVEGDAFELAAGFPRRPARRRPAPSLARSSVENSGFLPGWMPSATTRRVGDGGGVAHNVEMTVGDGIEGTGVEGDARHALYLMIGKRN